MPSIAVLVALLVLAGSASLAASAELARPSVDADPSNQTCRSGTKDFASPSQVDRHGCVTQVEPVEVYSPQVPTWFRDAKFGIFMHFGIHSATEYNAWYGRRMYEQFPFPEEQWCEIPTDPCVYNHHVRAYGHPSVFGFKDFIPMWTAERWDPDALAAFYKLIGVKYIVPVAMYHDNFDNFNSSRQRWNSFNMGPKRDIVGEWRKACDKYGLRLGVSDHASRAWQWMATSHGSDVTGPFAGVPYDGIQRLADGEGKWWQGYDPQELYLPPRAPNTTFADIPDSFKQLWYDRATELVETYKPDILYFDWGAVPNEPYGSMLTSKFIGSSAQRHRGASQAIVTYKGGPRGDNFVQDLEKGRFVSLSPDAWQVDTTLNNDWFYIKGGGLRMTGAQVILYLVDVVSKNGNLLLNVGLMPDGTLPDDQRKALTEVGLWLATNGEAIFDTRPWVKFGEGPTNDKATTTCLENAICDVKTSAGGIPITTDIKNYTNEDIRFTTKGGRLFAIIMDRPGPTTLITSLPCTDHVHAPSPAMCTDGKVFEVKMLGHAEPLDFSRDTTGMTVVWPSPLEGQHAWALEISMYSM